MLTKLYNQEKIINYEKLSFKRDKNLEFDFSDYRSLKEIHYKKISKGTTYKRSIRFRLMH